MDALTSVGTRHDPVRGDVWSDTPGAVSFITMWLQGEARWGTWNVDPELDLFDLPEVAQHLHWLSWPDVFWNDGHSSGHFYWAWIFWRRWLETEDPWAWWAFSQLSEWSMTSGLCWSDATAKRAYEGWPWYEKSGRGGSRQYPGAFVGFPVANYKVYTRSQAAAWFTFRGQPWAERGWAAHTAALHRMGYESWDGQYGARIVGYGMINLVTAWRATGDPALRDRAIATAMRAIEISRDPARLALEPNPRWRNELLGLPWWSNPAANVPHEANWFEQIQVGVGLCRVARYCASGAERNLIEQKIGQVCRFVLDECLVDKGTLMLARYKRTYDGVPAFYNSRTVEVNIERASDFTLSWLPELLLYGTAIGVPGAHAALARLHSQFGEFVDWQPNVALRYWEGLVISCDFVDGSVVLETEVDLVGVDPAKHGVRIALHDQHAAGKPEIAAVVVPISDVPNIMHLTVADTTSIPDAFRAELASHAHEIRYQITGPILSKVATAGDMAVRRVDLMMSARPPADRPFDFHAGLHFNSATKDYAQPLNSGDATIAGALGR